MRAELILLATLSAMCGPVHAQAFGVNMGMASADLPGGAPVPTAPYLFNIIPPDANPNFLFYQAIATPLEGVCMVQGFTEFDDRFSAQQLVNQLWGPLEQRYGARQITESYDYLFEQAMPPNLSRVWLLHESATVVIRYEFSNYQACQSELATFNMNGL